MNDSQILNNMVYTFQITDIDFMALCNILFLDDLKRHHTPIIFRSVVLSSYRRAPASRVMILSLTRRNNIVDISSYHFILTIIHDSSHPIFRYKFKSILQRRRRLESNKYFCLLNITHSCKSIFFQNRSVDHNKRKRIESPPDTFPLRRHAGNRDRSCDRPIYIVIGCNSCSSRTLQRQTQHLCTIFALNFKDTNLIQITL